MNKKHLYLLMVALSSFGCASTTIRSATDPSFANTAYSTILVISTFPDLLQKNALEEHLVNAFLSYKVRAYAGYLILPPTRQYSAEEINIILSKYGIDALLIVALQDFWASQTYIPPTITTQGSATLINNTLSYSTKTQAYGGFISKPRVTFESRLFDVKTGTTVWVSSSLTKGNAFAKFSDLASSLSNKSVEKLFEDQIIISSLQKPRGLDDSPFAARSTKRQDEPPLTKDEYDENEPLNPTLADSILLEAENLYKDKKHGEALKLAGELRNRIQSSAYLENRFRYLASINLLYGAYFFDITNQPNAAKTYFEDVAKLMPDLELDETIYGQKVIEYIRASYPINKKNPEIVKKEAPAKQPQLASESSIK